MNGRFIVAEGNEGAGKGSFVSEVHAWCQHNDKRLFDLIAYGAERQAFPAPEELDGYDALLSQEPSPAWVGRAIREEMVKHSDRQYSGREMGQAWSVDRLILYRRVIHPALERGMTVFSDRSVASSIVYQPIREPDPMPLPELLALPGQRLAFETKMDHMLIFLVKPEEGLTRLAAREKQDHAVFDRLDFMRKVDERYRSAWFRELFEKQGTALHLIDTTGTTVEDTHKTISHLFATIL